MVNNLHIKIKRLREKSHFSQTYIAEQLGISRPTLVLIEEGERELSISEAKKLASIFGMQLEDFLAGMKPTTRTITLEPKDKHETAETKDIRIVVPRANIGKFKEVLLYILAKVGAKPNIGETALYKLLYFIDFDFYEKFEEQITGARYLKNRYGPTPIEFKKIVEEMERDGEVERLKSKYFQYDQKKYLPLKEPDLRKLTAREIKHVDEVLGRLSDKNANELTEYSHSDVPWRVHKNGEIISYESVFYRDQDHSVKNYEDEF